MVEGVRVRAAPAKFYKLNFGPSVVTASCAAVWYIRAAPAESNKIIEALVFPGAVVVSGVDYLLVLKLPSFC